MADDESDDAVAARSAATFAPRSGWAGVPLPL